MKFGEAAKYGFKHIFVFEGRARRSEFWWFYLALELIAFPIMLILSFVMMASFVPALTSLEPYDPFATPDFGALAATFGLFGATWLLTLLVSVALNVILLGAMARRLHDMGQSAQWLWLNLLGLGIVPLIMCFMDTQPFANQWGPDPKALERGYPGAVSYGAPPAYVAATATPPPPPATIPPPPGDPFVR